MDYQAEIARLEKLSREADMESRARQQEAWKKLAADPENWEWLVDAVGTYRSNLANDWPGCECCRVQKRIRPELLAAWAKGGFSTFSNDWQEPGWRGMVYIRTNEGILTHAGGGHLILRDPMLVSDEEWAQICAGDIPAKYKR